MKKNLVLFLSVCFLSFNAIFAQNIAEDVKVTWGNQHKERSGSYITEVVGIDAEQVYVLRYQRPASGLAIFQNNPVFLIEAYDKEGNFKFNRGIPNEYDKMRMDFEFVIHFNNRLLLFTSNYDRPNKTNVLYMHEIDKRTLAPKGSPKKVAYAKGRSRMNAGGFDYKLSFNRKQLVIVDLAAYKGNEQDEFGAQVFDKDMNLLWRKDMKLPYKDMLFDIEGYEVDNKGNFYLMGIVYEGRAVKRRGGKPNYQYSIWAYIDEGNNTKEYKMGLSESFITDMTFKVSNNGEIVCAGFYSPNKTYQISGTFYQTIDPQTASVELQTTKAFDKGFLAEFMSDKKAKKGRRGLNRFDLDNMVLRGDGGAILMAEQFYVDERITRSSPGMNRSFGNNTRVDYYYYYNDIIVVNIAPSGEIEWATKVPKSQVTQNDGGHFSSYSYMLKGRNIHLIYNDNPKNLFPDVSKTFSFNGKKSVVTLATLSSEGHLKRSLLFSNRDERIITRPKACEQMSLEQMVIFGEWGRRAKGGVLTFD
ncbi:MAG: hypothetical protein AB8B69_11120 [Chitinophagales bacterium]